MLAALVLLLFVALVVGWEILCLGDVFRADRVRLLARWAWAVGCLFFIPLGGVLTFSSAGSGAAGGGALTWCHAGIQRADGNQSRAEASSSASVSTVELGLGHPVNQSGPNTRAPPRRRP